MASNLIFWKKVQTPICNRGYVPNKSNMKLMAVLCQKFDTLHSFLMFMRTPFSVEKYTKCGTWHMCNINRLSQLNNTEVLQWLKFLKSTTSDDLFQCICEHVVEVFIDTEFNNKRFRDLYFLLDTDEFCLPTWKAICKWGHTCQSSKAYYSYLFSKGARFTPLALNVMFDYPNRCLFGAFVKTFFTDEKRGIARVFLGHMITGRQSDFIDYYFFCRQFINTFNS